MRLLDAIRERAYGVALVATAFGTGYFQGALEAVWAADEDGYRERRRYRRSRRAVVWLAKRWTGSATEAESLAVESEFPPA